MVKDFLKRQGFHPAEPLAEQQTWLAWYQGRDKWHEYMIWNGRRNVGQVRDGMHMAKQVCQDWASLLFNERVEIVPEDEAFAKALAYVLDRNFFRHRANQLIELTFALGTGAFVEYLDFDGEVAIDYVRGDCIYPLAWDNGEITECAFASLRQDGDKQRYYVNIHALADNGTYVVSNHLIDKKGGTPVDLPDGVTPEVLTGSPLPRFQIITPNIVNNVDLDSPFGISVYANAISRLKKVDLIFDSGNNEFSLGRKRIIVPEHMTTRMTTENMEIQVFDPNDVAFYALPVGDSTDQRPIDLTGQLRISEHSQGLQDALNYLSEGVGLGADRYEYRQGGAKTATEVVSEKSDLYQNLQRHELILEKALRDLCRVVAEMTGHNPDQAIAISFDDSIINDRSTDIEEAIRLTTAGLQSRQQAIMDLFGLTEEQAQAELAQILQEDMGGAGAELQETYGLE